MFQQFPITGRTESNSKTLNCALDSILDHGLTVEELSDTEDWKRYKSKVKERLKIGISRAKNGLMLFSETGKRSKIGQPFHGDKNEVISLDLFCVKKRKKPAICKWRTACSICKSNKVSPVPLNIRRKSSYISEYGLAQSFTRLGRMSTNKVAGMTAHYYCLYYAACQGMVQDFKLRPEEYLEGFPITEILKTIESAEEKKCSYCSGVGAASECANLKCTKEGWYHFPCGLKNNSFQTVNRTFCARHGEEKIKTVGLNEKKKRGRKPGVQKSNCAVISEAVESQESMSSQESFSLLIEDQPTHNVEVQTRCPIGEHSRDTFVSGLNNLDLLLEPICFLDIVSEMESSADPIVMSNDSPLVSLPVNGDIVNTEDCEHNSSFNVFTDVQEAEENNQTDSLPENQTEQSEVIILQNQLTEYETLLEKRTKENDDLEERHKSDIEYKQSIIENLTKKLQTEKDAQKVLTHGKRIQIDILKKESARLSQENEKLLNENIQLKQEAENLHQSSVSALRRDTLETESKNLQIEELKREKAHLILRMRSLGNQLIMEAASNEDLGNEYVEESFPDNHDSDEGNIDAASNMKRELADSDLDSKDLFNNKKFKFG